VAIRSLAAKQAVYSKVLRSFAARYTGRDSFAFSSASMRKKIKDRRHLAGGGNSPPDCCI